MDLLYYIGWLGGWWRGGGGGCGAEKTGIKKEKDDFYFGFQRRDINQLNGYKQYGQFHVLKANSLHICSNLDLDENFKIFSNFDQNVMVFSKKLQ
jgi:hypothetical protein